jgi:ABC-type branched-subunit amino acid transport system ATPase component
MLVVDNLRAGYGKKEVLHGITLTVRPAEIVALIGPNGAGKSTLLKAMAGLMKPSGGEIRFDDQTINALSPRDRNRRGIGYLQQGGVIFPSLSILENLELAKHASVNGNAAKGIGIAFEVFPALGALQCRRAGVLSGGERQMLAVAMLLIQRPRLMLLDEPSAGLAPAMVNGIIELLKSRNREDDVAVLLVEQNVRVALDLAHRTYRLVDGRTTEVSHDALRQIIGAPSLPVVSGEPDTDSTDPAEER